MRKEVIGLAELWLGDCREIAPGLDRPAAVISDPPYGQKLGFIRDRFAADDRKNAVFGDDEPFDPRPWLSLADSVVLWGAHHFYNSLPPPQIACQPVVGLCGISGAGAATIIRVMQKWLGSIALRWCA